MKNGIVKAKFQKQTNSTDRSFYLFKVSKYVKKNKKHEIKQMLKR